MAKQYDSPFRSTLKGNVTKTTVGAIGGGIGMRLIIDETVATSRQAVLQAGEAICAAIMEDTWPLA
ncbi:MAG: hypothetical protein ACKO1J_00775 [Tagaea sp.]